MLLENFFTSSAFHSLGFGVFSTVSSNQWQRGSGSATTWANQGCEIYYWIPKQLLKNNPPISKRNLPTPKKHLIGLKEQKRDCVRGTGAGANSLWKHWCNCKLTTARFVLSETFSPSKVISASRLAWRRLFSGKLARYSATDFFKSSFNSTSWSCSKNHSLVSFRFFKGGSAIASQDKRLNHLFSTLGTMTMTQKVSAQSVPCHLLFKKTCIPSIKFEPRTTVHTNICNYFGKNNLHAVKDERERLHHINRACYCHALIAFSDLSNCHP